MPFAFLRLMILREHMSGLAQGDWMRLGTLRAPVRSAQRPGGSALLGASSRRMVALRGSPQGKTSGTDSGADERDDGDAPLAMGVPARTWRVARSQSVAPL